ncbi:MAG: hypothetical protein HZA20_12345 [Nitrospirae bacterium]|nr:hypothetical protein [Nitrospirota bacterium]
MLGIKCLQGDEETVRELVIDGLMEEKKRIEYALSISEAIIRQQESNHGISSAVFIDQFRNNQVDENDDTFQWWAELKLAEKLNSKLEKRLKHPAKPRRSVSCP